MSWAGPFTVLLLMSASLLELDKDSDFLQILQDHEESHHEDMNLKRSSLFTQLEQLDPDRADYSSNLQYNFGYQLSGYPEGKVIPSLTTGFGSAGYDGLKYTETTETRPAGNEVCFSLNGGKAIELESQYHNETVTIEMELKKIPSLTLDPVLITENKNDLILSLDQVEDRHFAHGNKSAIMSNSCFDESEIRECGHKSVSVPDLKMNDLECEKYQIDVCKPLASSSGFTNSTFFSLTQDNTVVMQDPLPDGQIQKQDLFTDGSDYDRNMDLQRGLIADAFDAKSKPEADQAELVTDANSVSVTEVDTSLLYGHITEPLEQWWKDDRGKYLREYIRDIKRTLKTFSTLVKYAEQITSVYNRLGYLISHLDELSFDRIATSTQYLISWTKSLIDGVAFTLSEVCRRDGEVRVAIRHFMHYQDHRFNYIWYCFYTIWNSLNLTLMFKMLKKFMVCIFRVLHLVYRMLKKIFGRTNMVHSSVGTTDPYDHDHPSMILVQVDVFRSLMESSEMETEMERLEQIRELEEQVAYAKKMAEWSAGKREWLEEEIDRLAEDIKERMMGNTSIDRVVASLDNIVEVHNEESEA